MSVYVVFHRVKLVVHLKRKRIVRSLISQVVRHPRLQLCRHAEILPFRIQHRRRQRLHILAARLLHAKPRAEVAAFEILSRRAQAVPARLTHGKAHIAVCAQDRVCNLKFVPILDLAQIPRLQPHRVQRHVRVFCIQVARHVLRLRCLRIPGPARKDIEILAQPVRAQFQPLSRVLRLHRRRIPVSVRIVIHQIELRLVRQRRAAKEHHRQHEQARHDPFHHIKNLRCDLSVILTFEYTILRRCMYRIQIKFSARAGNLAGSLSLPIAF